MREDLQTIYRHRDDRDELQDASNHRSVVCIAWATIYQVEDYALYQYGSVSAAHLPAPDTRWGDCRRSSA